MGQNTKQGNGVSCGAENLRALRDSAIVLFYLEFHPDAQGGTQEVKDGGGLEAVLGDLGSLWGRFWRSWGGLGAVLGRPCDALGVQRSREFIWTLFGAHFVTSSRGPYEGILYYFWLL